MLPQFICDKTILKMQLFSNCMQFIGDFELFQFLVFNQTRKQRYEK